MTYSEFVEHIAYYRLYRWGDDWLQAGTIAHATSAPHVKKAIHPEGFIPSVKRIRMKPRQTVQQMKAILFGGARQIQGMMGGK